MSRFQVDRSRVREVVLVRQDRGCPACGAKMHIRCDRTRNIHTLEGPMRLIVKLLQCRNEECDTAKTFAPEEEAEYAMPRWGIGWDVFCWMGQRRFARHWSVCQIRHELADSYDIPLSDDAIEDHLASYQNMVAARHQDLGEMERAYRGTREVVLTIDGLQPEKGHETLYVVREATRNRVWFAEPLLSGTTAEIRKLFVRAKHLARTLRLKVVLWISDKQDAFLKCIAAEFPGVPHRYCENHFFRDLAKPVLDLDSTAKTKMRGKIRGLRALEREVLDARQADARKPFARRWEQDVVAGWGERRRGARLLQCGAWYSERQSRRSRPSGRAANARSPRRCAEVAQPRCFVRKSRSGVRSAGATEGIHRSWRGGSAEVFHPRAGVYPTGASGDELVDQ